MSNNWNLIYYEDENENAEVYDFINSQKSSNKAKILSWLSMLKEKGPVLPRPYADLLKDGIHELRIKLSGNQVRVLYFFCYKDFIVLTNCFTKNRKQVPEKEINKAKKYRDNFLKRYSEAKLRKEFNENL